MDYFAFVDVTLLILLFFHRYMLRRYGLWKDASSQDTFSTTTMTTSVDQKSRPSMETIEQQSTMKNLNNITERIVS